MTDSKWEKKLCKLKKEFPEIGNINWNSIIRDQPDVFTNVLGDVARGGISKNKVTPSVASEKLAQISNNDFSELSFIKAFAILQGEHTVRSLANKTNLSPTMIFNLQKGNMEPSFEIMEKIAKGFNKKPSYFLEYRIGKIMSSISIYLNKSPEIASMWYEEISKNEGIKIK